MDFSRDQGVTQSMPTVCRDPYLVVRFAHDNPLVLHAALPTSSELGGSRAFVPGFTCRDFAD